jgi:hypothetical protein
MKTTALDLLEKRESDALLVGLNNNTDEVATTALIWDKIKNCSASLAVYCPGNKSTKYNSQCSAETRQN